MSDPRNAFARGADLFEHDTLWAGSVESTPAEVEAARTFLTRNAPDLLPMLGLA